MLYADKAALENRTKLRLLAIRERELALYTKNCFTIGTVSALMAGLAYSSLLYATKRAYYQDASALIQTMYVMGNVTSMYLALRAMTGTTMIAMFAPGKVRAPSTFSHWRQFPRRGADGGAWMVVVEPRQWWGEVGRDLNSLAAALGWAGGRRYYDSCFRSGTHRATGAARSRRFDARDGGRDARGV